MTSKSPTHNVVVRSVCSGCLNEYEGPLPRCGRCHGPFYCSEECQKKEWKKIHKYECGNIMNMARSDQRQAYAEKIIDIQKSLTLQKTYGFYLVMLLAKLQSQVNERKKHNYGVFKVSVDANELDYISSILSTKIPQNISTSLPDTGDNEDELASTAKPLAHANTTDISKEDIIKIFLIFSKNYISDTTLPRLFKTTKSGSTLKRAFKFIQTQYEDKDQIAVLIAFTVCYGSNRPNEPPQEDTHIFSLSTVV